MSSTPLFEFSPLPPEPPLEPLPDLSTLFRNLFFYHCGDAFSIHFIGFWFAFFSKKWFVVVFLLLISLTGSHILHVCEDRHWSSTPSSLGEILRDASVGNLIMGLCIAQLYYGLSSASNGYGLCNV